MANEPKKTPGDQGKSVKRSHRRRRTGKVVSDKAQKSITVQVDYLTKFAKYGKYIRRRTKVHAHDESDQAKVGDVVEIAECRPISKSKSWRLVRIVRPS